jgi:hypothetical protein
MLIRKLFKSILISVIFLSVYLPVTINPDVLTRW